MKNSKKHYTMINISKKNNNDFSLIIRTENDNNQLGLNTNTLINNLSTNKIEDFINNELYVFYKNLRIIDIKGGIIGISPNSDDDYYVLCSDIITAKFQKMILLRYMVDRTLISRSINKMKSKLKSIKK
ncbi:MAG: hypothetical protein PHS45_05035 [Bacilli bacterium]|nr:hypothetical protein [Bacilli bacterium]